jgi:hypothetical protein
VLLRSSTDELVSVSCKLKLDEDVLCCFDL